MAGKVRGVAVSQGAFDALVAENVEEFGMDAEEAAEDAVRALTLQGADLTGNTPLAPQYRDRFSYAQQAVGNKAVAVQGSDPCSPCWFLGGLQASTRPLRPRELPLFPWTT